MLNNTEIIGIDHGNRNMKKPQVPSFRRQYSLFRHSRTIWKIFWSIRIKYIMWAGRCRQQSV